MRATNLGYKNPHEIYHAPFYDAKVDNKGRSTIFAGKDGSVRKPRAITADRFDNPFSKNYSTNQNLSPTSYNPLNGTIAGELKNRTTIRYVDDAVGMKDSNLYTISGNLKIFHPDILSPKHKRIYTPVHSKSKSVDLGAGFNRSSANLINSLMETLENKRVYEIESAKQTASDRTWTTSDGCKTPVKGHYDSYKLKSDTPSTRLSAFSNGSLTFHGISNQISTFNSMTPSKRPTPRLPLSDSPNLTGSKGKEVSESEGYFSRSGKSQADLPEALTTGDARKASSRKSSCESLKGRKTNSTTLSRKNSASSKISAKQLEYENRFESPKSNIQILSIDLKSLTAKVNQKRRKEGKECAIAFRVDGANKLMLGN